MQLQIETCGQCNASCHFCIYPSEANAGRRGRMSMDLFRQVIDEAATMPVVDSVILTGLSESLLDPDLEARCEYVKERMPQVFLYAYTNGTYLTVERFLKLQTAGLDMLLVSLNAADAETRKRVMGLDDWSAVIANVTAAIAHETTCKVRIRAVTNIDSFTIEDAQPLFRLWGIDGKGGRVMTVREGNWTGDSRTVRDFKPNECCTRALDMIYVTFEGKVTPCCFDPLGKLTFGNVNAKPLRQIYNGDTYRTFREDHYNDKADRHDVCRGCTRI